ncbi:MAG: DUF7288 family protein [Halobacteriota archaeon]
MVGRRRTLRDEDRGQIHTIEGFTAAFIIIAAALYGVQSVAITPTSSSTASQEVELNNYKLADDVLATTNANGELKEALLNWSASDEEFRGSIRDDDYYKGTDPGDFDYGGSVPGDLGDTLNETLTQRGLAYNIELTCADTGGTQMLAENGDPSNHASTATTVVSLYDHDEVHSTSGDVTLAEVESDPDLEFYCERIDDDSTIHSAVEVKITIWRM